MQPEERNLLNIIFYMIFGIPLLVVSIAAISDVVWRFTECQPILWFVYVLVLLILSVYVRCKFFDFFKR